MWSHGVLFTRVTLLTVDVIIRGVHNHRTHQQLPKRLQLPLQLRRRHHLKENQANLGIVKATVMEMAVGKNVRPAVLTVGRVMVYAMIRVLTLLVTMMMVIAQPYPQLICQQHLLQHQNQQSNQRQIQQSNQRQDPTKQPTPDPTKHPTPDPTKHPTPAPTHSCPPTSS